MSTPFDADISDQSSVILNLKFPTFQDAPNNQLMLLYFTHKSHTGPPLRYIPMIVCKGTKKQAQYKTKNDFFAFIVEREYLRASLRGTN